MIPGPDFIESRIEIGDHAGKYIQASGGALGIRSGPDRLGEGDAFEQRNQVDMPLFENGALGEVHLIHHQIRLIEIQDIQPAVISLSSGRKLLMSR